MYRPYQYRTWNEIMKARDALQILCDIGVDEELYRSKLEEVCNEIHVRFKNGSTKGGNLAHVITQADRDDHVLGDGE